MALPEHRHYKNTGTTRAQVVGYNPCMRMLASLLLLVSVSLNAAPLEFDLAQQAAAEGRFEDVTVILSEVIASGSLTQEHLAIAHSNRGIAFSLLNNYSAAKRDLNEAIRLNPTHQLSLNHLGILAEHVEQDIVAAAGWYRQAAELGYPASMVNLGNIMRSGRLGRAENGEAFALFQRAWELGYDSALAPLGEMYLYGRGTPQDPETGLRLLSMAVEAGQVTAHYELGRAYEKGTGVTRDYRRAAEHYRLAAIEGHAPSQGALGYLYRRGHGFKKDFVEAARWYRLAAEQGDVTAANRLAWIMATCPVKEVCNGRVAKEFAQLAVAAEPSASNLDSLAAAHARIGEFDEALAVIEQLLAEQELSPSARAKYAHRIARYRNGIPFQL